VPKKNNSPKTRADYMQRFSSLPSAEWVAMWPATR